VDSKDTKDIVAEAATPCIKGLMLELDVKTARMYEILSKDNPYPKLWRILRPLGRLNPTGLRLIQADFNARCAAILDVNPTPVSCAQIHQELSDVVQAHLSDKQPQEQRQELIEARSVIDQRLNELNTLSNEETTHSIF
jgi:hypothetical protein